MEGGLVCQGNLTTKYRVQTETIPKWRKRLGLGIENILHPVTTDTLYPSGYGRWINSIRYFCSAVWDNSFTYMISRCCGEAVSGTYIAVAGGNINSKQLFNVIEYVSLTSKKESSIARNELEPN